jgi:hypothetical protein
VFSILWIVLANADFGDLILHCVFMSENRDSIIVYRSFIEAGKEISNEKERLKFYEAIFTFGLDHEENDLSGIAKGMFMLVKPQLLANKKRWENGNKPKQKTSKTEAKDKQEESKTEANNNVNNNNNINENKNENKNEILTTRTGILGIDFIQAYKDTSEEFKSLYDETFYKSWLSINKHLNENCTYLRTWDDQITVKQFKAIYDRIQNNEISIEQTRQALSDLDGSKLAKDKYSSVYHGFNTFIKTILRNV